MPNLHTEEKPQTSTNVSQLLTVHEVAQILRVDDTTVRRWVKYGILEAVSLPHMNTRQSYRIKKETVDTLLNQGLNAVSIEQNEQNVHHASIEE